MDFIEIIVEVIVMDFKPTHSMKGWNPLYKFFHYIQILPPKWACNEFVIVDLSFELHQFCPFIQM